MHQSFAALGAAAGEELTAALGGHTGTEADLADALDLRRLPSHFHGTVSSRLNDLKSTKNT